MNTVELPFSQACENNKEPILTHIRPMLRDATAVLEIGSGTGQHAVHFAAGMPWLIWQTTDLEENHAGIAGWVDKSGVANARKPLKLDVIEDPWPDVYYDAVFSANTMHIIPWDGVVQLIEGAAARLVEGGIFICYGPFLYGGRPTSDSNAAFDRSLRQTDPEMGLREIGNVIAVAADCGLQLEADCAMPANNRLLVWRRA